MKLYSYFNKYISNNNDLSSKVRLSIIYLTIFRVIGIIAGFLIVPQTLRFVTKSEYGIWLTLSSMIGWISLFDLGITNGLRNLFAVAKSNNKIILSRIYISSVYFYLSIIFSIVLILLLIFNSFFDWSIVFGNIIGSNSQIRYIFVFIVIYFCFQFILRTLGVILTVDHKPHVINIIDVLGQVLTLSLIFLLNHITKGNIFLLTIVSTIPPLFFLLIANYYYFKNKYKYISPNFKFVRWSLTKNIFKLGGKFFIIQIASIIQYQTTLFLISKYFSSESVVKYNITFKYFSILNLVFGVVITPFWSAVTEAYAKKNITWIKNSINMYLKIACLFVFVGFIMLFLSDKFYTLWIPNQDINIPFILSTWVMISSLATIFSGIFVSVINGIGKIQIQLYFSFLSPFVFLFLSYFFVVKLKYGIEGIIIATLISNFTGLIIIPIQCYKILNSSITK
jgi:O-antigen/teichoic acid export membrane protein